MDIKETGKKLKPFAPVLSVALVTACVAGSLSGYEAPVYAATQEETPVKKEETKEKKEEKKTAAKGTFDLEDGVYKGTGTGYAGDITVSGATFSSRGIISAVKNALTGEKDTSETGQAQSGQTGAAAGSSTSVAQVEDVAAYKDGTYYGSGTGFGGPLKVMVEISGGKIASIQIVENSDGSDYISKAASLIDSIITTQSTNVDTVSGATYSSVGIIQAVRDALGQAAVNGTSDSTQNNNNNSSSDDDSSTVTGTVPYKEGIYYGTAEGYSGDVSVAVVIQEKTIKAILITESSDDEAFFNRAMDVVKKVIRTQKTDDVDTVSGATYSSKGLLNAIKNALKQAEKVTNGESIDEKPDLTELKELIEKAEKLEEDKYTETSWAVLQTRLADAKDTLEETKQTAVDKAVEKLKTAIAQLESKDGKDEENTKYVSGTYEVTVPCTPDEDEDFEEYELTMSVEIRNDKIVSITDITGDGASSNDSYIKRAVNGTSSIKGVVSQIIDKGMPEDIDTVSRATCSSNAILEGCKKVLEAAERPTDMEAE